jgi:ribonuclease R
MIKKLFVRLLKNEQNFTEEEIKYLNPLIKDKIVSNNEGYMLSNKYRVGVLKVQNKHAVLEDLINEHKNIKLEFEQLKGAYDNDLVLVQRVFNPKSKIKAKVIKVLESAEHELLVYLKNAQLFTVKESIHLEHIKHSYDVPENEVFIINSKTYEILEHLGNLNDPNVDEKISLHLYHEHFRLDERFDVHAKMDDTKQRVDLTHLAFTTIDPATAKDHDDAIYYDKDEHAIYVAIADVSYFVQEGSPLDEAAFKKSTSIYLPNKVLPMLPASLSEEMCSLKEGENRYAYVFKILLDGHNNVKKSQLFEAIIKSHKKFSYGRIDRVLQGQLDLYNETEKTIFDYIVPLYEITKNIRAKRLKKGYDFRSIEHRLQLNHKQELEAVVSEESTAAHQLVEECMLLANIEASKKVTQVGIFRIHEEPSFQAISKLVDEVNILGINAKVKDNVHETIVAIQQQARHSVLSQEIDELIIQAQTQAKYSSRNLGHFGLGFSSYSHFTSPIRRYSDLVLHRMLKTKKVPSSIDAICEHISVQERKVDMLVWDLEDRKYARWASKHINEEFKAQIVDEERGIAKFYTNMSGLRVYLDNYKGQKLFTKLRVIIKEVNIVSHKIIASIKY